jgi:hypothetical protein
MCCDIRVLLLTEIVLPKSMTGKDEPMELGDSEGEKDDKKGKQDSAEPLLRAGS